MLNNKTLETNMGKIKKLDYLKTMIPIKNSKQNIQYISKWSHYNSIYSFFCVKKSKGGRNKIKAADRNEI